MSKTLFGKTLLAAFVAACLSLAWGVGELTGLQVWVRAAVCAMLIPVWVRMAVRIRQHSTSRNGPNTHPNPSPPR